MKKMKKLMAMLLALTMVLGMSVTVFAEKTSNVETKDVTGTESDKGSITINGIDAETKEDQSSNVKVYAFKVVEAVYGETDDKFTGYRSLYETELPLNKNGGLNETEIATNLATLAGKIAYDAEQNKWLYNGTTELTPIMLQSSGASYVANNVAVGSYLVLVQGSEAKFYNPIIASVSYVGKETEDGAVSGVQSDVLGITNGVAWVKVSGTPDIGKTATVPDRTENDTNTDASSVNVGETINYEVTVNPIPKYDGIHPKFKVIDTLSTGLKFDKTEDQDISDIVKVYVIDATASFGTLSDEQKTAAALEKTKYSAAFATTEVGKEELTVDFVLGDKKDNYTLNDYAGKQLVIVYPAKVTDKAGMNATGNNNEAKLQYSKDSNLESGDDPNPPTAKTYNYTFDLSTNVSGSETDSILNKVGQETATSTTSKPLGGAVFTLYTDADTKIVYNSDGKNTLVATGGTVTSKDDGKLVIRGLAAGTYYLKETFAPAGYTLNNTVYKIEINASYKADGQLDSWTITTTEVGGTNAPYVTEMLPGGVKEGTVTKIEIPNTSLASLPSTGGIGTTIFTFGGCAIMILAAGLYFASRRRSAK